MGNEISGKKISLLRAFWYQHFLSHYNPKWVIRLRQRFLMKYFNINAAKSEVANPKKYIPRSAIALYFTPKKVPSVKISAIMIL